MALFSKRTWWLAVWFGALAAISLYSRSQIHGRQAARCSLDGQRIEPVYEVDLIEGDTLAARFCCIVCAREWPDVPARSWWRVHDELTGAPLDADMASFVESSVVTVASRRCRTHAFESWVDAMNHVATYGGERIASPLIRGASPRDREQEKNDAKHE